MKAAHPDQVVELEQLRETIRRLNRRCQSAESGLAVKLEEVKRQGSSIGRALANAAATMYAAQIAEARAEAWKPKASIEKLRVILDPASTALVPRCDCGAAFGRPVNHPDRLPAKPSEETASTQCERCDSDEGPFVDVAGQFLCFDVYGCQRRTKSREETATNLQAQLGTAGRGGRRRPMPAADTRTEKERLQPPDEPPSAESVAARAKRRAKIAELAEIIRREESKAEVGGAIPSPAPRIDYAKLTDAELDAGYDRAVADSALAHQYEHNAHCRPGILAAIATMRTEYARRHRTALYDPPAAIPSPEPTKEKTHCDGRDRPELCDIILPGTAPCRKNRGLVTAPLHAENSDIDGLLKEADEIATGSDALLLHAGPKTIRRLASALRNSRFREAKP